jgi:hypothetical protein
MKASLNSSMSAIRHTPAASRACARRVVIAAPAPQDQPRAHRPQIRIEAGKTVMQPPALRRAHPPRRRRLIIQHEQRHDRPARRRCNQGGVIGEAQIVAEPDKLGGHGHGLSTSRRASR